MSRKSKRNRPAPARAAAQAIPMPGPQAAAAPPAPSRPMQRQALFWLAVVGLLAAFVIGALVYNASKVAAGQSEVARKMPLLMKDYAPTTGNAAARVHVVEFLDPACGTCARFYPEVKKLMAANPERIRLSVRHVPFHRGSEPVVRILEAARLQGKYWEALEALLARQDTWVYQHVAYADRVWPILELLGLDLDRLRVDMHGAEISRRIAQDLADAGALGVTKTPEYFVNGRPLPTFGLEPLQSLVAEEVRAAYR